MPELNGTGPMGIGPITGDARGPCNVYGNSLPERDFAICLVHRTPRRDET